MSGTDYHMAQTSNTRRKVRQSYFFSTIINTFNYVLNYENKELHEYTKAVIPIDKLRLIAIKKLRKFQNEIKLNDGNDKHNLIGKYEMSIEDFLLEEITHWFKNEFFSWMNNPTCKSCSGPCHFTRAEFPNDSKILKIEIHTCELCYKEEQFPRYTDLKMLLKTRKGRCGEWANAFTLICRALGYDARIIYDQTDHVWTEVWSVTSNRWIHIDPCEDILDRPLLYECGWNKKLSYVIAYSKDEIQDVTWRYTKDQSAVMSRRNLCSEEHLVDLIFRLNQERLMWNSNCSETRKQYIIKRRLMELVDLLLAPPEQVETYDQNNRNDYGKRISGSKAWKTARGES